VDCCVKKPCWIFITQGFCTIGQDEFVYIIECFNENDEFKDDKIPRQIFVHILDIYSKVSKGQFIKSMSYSLHQTASNNDNSDKNYFLENKDNAGFLYFQPSKYNCLKHLNVLLPNEPFLIGLLVQKWEIPWAKLFPLRLLLLLGAENKMFPFPIVSSRLRPPLCGEIGHTIMNLLCDLRNYQYTIPQIDGLYITIVDHETKIQIPQSQYNLVMKSILTSNDYVFSIASFNINHSCNSHLVAIENENSNSYTSRKNSAIGLSNMENDITGAAFIVFNGSLKPAINSTINAKLTIVEDGVMIQVDTETIEKLKQALQAMKPFRIECNKTLQSSEIIPEANDIILIEWYKEDLFINKNINSPIDNNSMCGINSIRLFNNSYDYMNETKLIRLTEIFIIRMLEDTSSVIETSFNLNRFVDSCSQSFCLALITLLDDLVNETSLLINSNNKTSTSKYDDSGNSFFKLALRVTVNRDVVEYQIGSNGVQISDEKYLSNLDNELIPLLHQVNNYNIDMCLELFFYVLDRYNIENGSNNLPLSANNDETINS
jgi:MAD (mothers against decapentaplegic) interacting protein